MRMIHNRRLPFVPGLFQKRLIWQAPTPGLRLRLNFLNDGPLDSRITFSRGTNATRINASGLIEQVGTSTPRFDYDPVTLAPRGLLIEEARTNLFLYSDQFNVSATWIPVAATVTANVTTSPDGTVNADKLAEDATTDVHSIYQTYSQTLGVTYTFSFYAKAAERTWVRTRGAVGVNYFNLANGTIGNLAAGATASITPAGNGWYRCAVTLTAPTTGLANNQIAPTTGNGVDNFAGTAGSGVFIYGAQQEVGAFATSYIPTVASTVSRSADVATMTGTNFSSWYNQSEGTVVASFDTLIGSSAIGVVFGGGSNVFQTRVDNGRARSGIRAVADLITGTGPVVSMPGSSKVASAYKSGDSAIAVNGAAAVTSATTFTATGGATVGLGFDVLSSANWINGRLQSLTYYNRRYSNAALPGLST